MIKNKYIIAFATMFALFVTACSSDEPQNASGDKYGTLSTRSIAVDVDEIIDNMARNADNDDINWTIEIMQGSQLVTQYAYENLPEVIRLQIGDYTIKVHSPNDLENAAFNSPYYEGTQSFTIIENIITEVEPVICHLVNTKVSIIIDDYLEQKTEGNWDVRIVANENGSSLDFRGHKQNPSEDSHSAGYFHVSKGSTLSATFTGTVSGRKIEMNETATVNNPGKEHHIFKFSVKTAD